MRAEYNIFPAKISTKNFCPGGGRCGQSAAAGGFSWKSLEKLEKMGCFSEKPAFFFIALEGPAAFFGHSAEFSNPAKKVPHGGILHLLFSGGFAKM
ncbi:MAG: hypothetical protein HFF65_03390 [Oscillospiraceae bacterium]|nr:hypothetical protein [Oscillospiraceae bacterium]MCI9391430.1 hypothetical protein [Oscillospiraceae bacterium]